MCDDSGAKRRAGRVLAHPLPGPDRPHLDERGSAVSIMLPPDSEADNGSPHGGWRADDLTPHDVAPLLDNFITKFQPGPADKCWLWHGTIMPNGYGVLGRSYRASLLAHRVAWVAFTGGSLTGNLTIDHLCNMRACVNPAHLEPVTLAENQRRKSERLGWMVGSRSGIRTSCEDCGLRLRHDSLRRHKRRVHPEAA